MKKKFLLSLLCLAACSSVQKTTPGFKKEAYVYVSHKEITGNICFIGDGGKGNAGQYLVGEALEKEKCEHIFYVGDIIYPDGLTGADDPLFVNNFVKPYAALINNKSFRQFHMALGNHDYKLNPYAWKDLALKHSYLVAHHLYYIEYYKNVCFFIIDSNQFLLKDEYENSKLQAEWLNFQLNNKKTCPISIAIAHHPYISSGGHGDASGLLKAFLEKYIIGHFDYFIAGHDHNLSDEGTYKGTRLFISGGAAEGKWLRRMPYQKGYAAGKKGFIKMNLNQDQIRSQFIEVEKENGKMITKVAAEVATTPLGLR